MTSHVTSIRHVRQSLHALLNSVLCKQTNKTFFFNSPVRCLEDHERLFDTLLQWKPKSENRIIFAQRPEKYDVFMRPERYLPSCETISAIAEDGRQTLLTTFFSSGKTKSVLLSGRIFATMK